MLMFQKEDFMFTFDLKSGYHHIDIHREHWGYLRFAWNNGSKVQYYVFVCYLLAWLPPAISSLSSCAP